MKKEYNVTLLCEITVEANSEAGASLIALNEVGMCTDWCQIKGIECLDEED